MEINDGGTFVNVASPFFKSSFTKQKLENNSQPSTLNNNDNVSKTAQTNAICAGANLKTYRLAVACTGEYAVAATGSATPTKAQTLAKVVTSVNRVDGVYETEVAVKLVLVTTDAGKLFYYINQDWQTSQWVNHWQYSSSYDNYGFVSNVLGEIWDGLPIF